MITEKQFCDKYLGVPYKHCGRTMEGLDCLGLVILAHKEIGIDVLDIENYDPNWSAKGKNYFLNEYHNLWVRVSVPKFMDLIMFSNNNGIPYHAGLYLSKNKFIQSALNVGVIITQLNSKWRSRLYGIYRHASIKD